MGPAGQLYRGADAGRRERQARRRCRRHRSYAALVVQPALTLPTSRDHSARSPSHIPPEARDAGCITAVHVFARRKPDDHRQGRARHRARAAHPRSGSTWVALLAQRSDRAIPVPSSSQPAARVRRPRGPSCASMLRMLRESAGDRTVFRRKLEQRLRRSGLIRPQRCARRRHRAHPWDRTNRSLRSRE